MVSAALKVSVQLVKLGLLRITGPSPDAGIVPDVEEFLQATVIGEPSIVPLNSMFAVLVAVKLVLAGLMLSSVLSR
jgi:hypothetical protein